MNELIEQTAAELRDSGTPEQARERGRLALVALRAEFQRLRALPAEERRQAGQALNAAKAAIERLLDERLAELAAETSQRSGRDPQLPIAPLRLGRVHPTTALLRRMNAFFGAMGFAVVEGPEIESDWYNFSALNLPPWHPAREMHDTIYLAEPSLLLRTHTSAAEIRAMELRPLPLRVVVPGKAYRAESVNATNASMFYQYEVLAVDRDLSVAHLRATIDAFLRFLFGEQVRTRTRAKYYPQVEPGLGVDLACRFCDGRGCGVCKGKGWIEILGGGMVHPNALEAAGIDWQEWSGFAFGLGLDRLVMTATGIADIRYLYGPRMLYISEV
jgi:phenylalanyl-tRNA synthetase alpha chain